MTTWHIAITPPQKEIVARRVLEQMGYRVSLPMGSKRVRARRGARKRSIRKFPLMKRYLFVRFETDLPPYHRLHDARSVIQRLLAHPPANGLAVPVALTDDEVERMIHIAESDAGAGEYGAFTEGQTVQIIGGAYEGTEGVIRKLRHTDAEIDISTCGRVFAPLAMLDPG
jgi:transcription antitermination factor NusG